MRVECFVPLQEKTDLQLAVAAVCPDSKLLALLQSMLAHKFFRDSDRVRRAEPALNGESARVEVRRIESPEGRIRENVNANDFEIIAGKIPQRNKPMDERRRAGNA